MDIEAIAARIAAKPPIEPNDVFTTAVKKNLIDLAEDNKDTVQFFTKNDEGKVATRIDFRITTSLGALTLPVTIEVKSTVLPDAADITLYNPNTRQAVATKTVKFTELYKYAWSYIKHELSKI